MRPPPQKQRPDLTQLVIRDRLAAVEPQRLDLLTHTHARKLRIVLEQPVDLILDGCSFDATAGRWYRGGPGERTARLTVFRSIP